MTDEEKKLIKEYFTYDYPYKMTNGKGAILK